MFYDGIPLPEVLAALSDESRQRDPEKLGLNFLISNTASGGIAQEPIDPFTGQLIEAQAVMDVNDVLVRLNAPLRNVRIRDVLDVIVAVANHPIHYSIENYGVVFSSGFGAPGQLPRAAPGTPAFVMDPELMRRYGLSGLPPGREQAATKNLSDLDRERIESKLDQIIFDEVFYDAIPFSDVVKDLDEMTRHHDPEGNGLNFIFNPDTRVSPIAGTAPFDQRGTLATVPTTDHIDLSNIIVKFNLPLRNVRLRDVLDAIKKVAEKPIQYSVENYGVIFSIGSVADQASGAAGNRTIPSRFSSMLSRAGLPPPPISTPVLEVRTFRVDTNTFALGLESAFGIQVGTQVNSPDSLDAKRLQIALRLAEPGVPGFPLNTQTDPMPNTRTTKVVFYNALTGIVLIRATAEDMKIVQAAMETLGSQPQARSEP